MENVRAAASLSAVNKIVPCREALHALSDVLGSPARIRMFSQQPESFGDSVRHSFAPEKHFNLSSPYLRRLHPDPRRNPDRVGACGDSSLSTFNVQLSTPLAVHPFEIAIQPPISTIPCKTLHSLANIVLPYFMLSPPTTPSASPANPSPLPFHPHRCHPERSDRPKSPALLERFRPCRKGSAFLCLLPACHSALATAPLSPLPATLLSRAVARGTSQTISLRFYLDAASSISPLFVTLTKNTRGGGPRQPRITNRTTRNCQASARSKMSTIRQSRQPEEGFLRV